ncbi:hypothetical protein COCOBI_14-0290 [Coccomyxa sp. Obi]|nr:hypothetical protein COCOBI_14-0290 [Coccomyxa sp. Obi]
MHGAGAGRETGWGGEGQRRAGARRRAREGPEEAEERGGGREGLEERRVRLEGEARCESGDKMLDRGIGRWSHSATLALKVEIGKDPGGGLNNEEVKGGQHTLVRRGAHKDTAVDKGSRENSGEDAGVANDNGVDKDLAPAMCDKLDAKGFVLVAFGNGSGVNVDVASARDLEEDNSVFAAMSRGPGH